MSAYTELKWKHRRGSHISAAITYADHYTISHRDTCFTLSYRPPGEHIPLGQFKLLREAKARAKSHDMLEAPLLVTLKGIYKQEPPTRKE